MLLLLLLPGLLGACGRERAGDPSLSLRVRVSPTPAAVGPARLLIELEGLASDSMPARITVVGSLPGGPVVHDSARAEAPGLHVVPAFVFPVRGEWTLRVRAELPDGRWAEIEHPVRVVGGALPPP